MIQVAIRRQTHRGWAMSPSAGWAMPSVTRSEADLCQIGIRSEDRELLGDMGVRSVQDLARRNVTLLVARLGHLSELRSPKRLAPGAGQVAEWVVAARAFAQSA